MSESSEKNHQKTAINKYNKPKDKVIVIPKINSNHLSNKIIF